MRAPKKTSFAAYSSKLYFASEQLGMQRMRAFISLVAQTIETRKLDFSRARLTEAPDLTLIGNAGGYCGCDVFAVKALHASCSAFGQS
jgi:hypothetical protein